MSKKKSASEKNDSGNGVADVRTAYFNFLQENMPRNWSIANMGELCEIQTGKLDVNQADDDGKYPFFTCAEKIYRINTATFDTEAVLVAGNGFFNVKYYKGKFNAYQRTYVLSDVGINGKYLYHYIDYRLSDITKNNRGSTIRYIRLGDLRDYPVAVAPDKEQERIVAEIEKQFSRLDEAVNNLKRVKANLKRYKASVLKAAVEGKLTEEWRQKHPDVEPAGKLLERILVERRTKWEKEELAKMRAKGKKPKDDKWKKRYKSPANPDIKGNVKLPDKWLWARLDSVAEIKGGITKDSKRKIKNGKELPYLRVANVQRGYLDLDKIKYIKVSKEKLPELLLEKGDILFNEGGDRDKLGRGWIWEGQIDKCTYQNHVFRARLYLKEINGKFFSWFGNTFGQQYFMAKGKQTTNLASINKTMLSAFPVPLPSFDEQVVLVKEIERRLSMINAVEKELDINLIRAERLRRSILKKAFSGKLLKTICGKCM